MPTLEKEYSDILKELEHEQEEVRQIEASDQGYLNDLKVSIAEQKYAYVLIFENFLNVL